MPDGSLQSIGLGHIAFKVDDIDAIIELAEQKEMHSLGCPKFYEVTGRTLFSVRDPDGGKVQFVEK